MSEKKRTPKQPATPAPAAPKDRPIVVSHETLVRLMETKGRMFPGPTGPVKAA